MDMKSCFRDPVCTQRIILAGTLVFLLGFTLGKKFRASDTKNLNNENEEISEPFLFSHTGQALDVSCRQKNTDVYELTVINPSDILYTRTDIPMVSGTLSIADYINNLWNSKFDGFAGSTKSATLLVKNDLSGEEWVIPILLSGATIETTPESIVYTVPFGPTGYEDGFIQCKKSNAEKKTLLHPFIILRSNACDWCD